MGGIAYEITVQDAAVQAMLTRAIARSVDLEPAFKMIGERMLASTLSRAEKQVAPDGSAWPALAESTIKSHERGETADPHKALFGESGRMLRELHANAGPMEVKWGTNVKSKDGFLYPIVHQEGSARVPKREWLGISAADEIVIHEILKHWIEGI